MNRVISVSVSEDALLEAFEWLMQKGVRPTALAAIPRLCVEVIAKQLETEVSEMTLAMFADFGMTGKKTTPRREDKRLAKGLVDYTPRDPYSAKAGHRHRVANFGDVYQEESDEAGVPQLPHDHGEYVQYVVNKGLNAHTFSYSDWQQAKKDEIAQEQRRAYERMFGAQNAQTNEVPAGCDPSLPIAAKESMEELNAKAEQRKQEAAEEKRLMEEHLQSLRNMTSGQTNRE